MLKKILFAAGGIAVLAAIFAKQLGIDNDAVWGTGRLLILKAGIILILFGVFLHFLQTPIYKAGFWIVGLLHRISREQAINIVFVSLVVLIGVAYNWFLRSEKDAHNIYNYYGELAKAFRHGNLYLEEKPSQLLISMSNPYDPALRKQEGIEDFPWDVSIYNGRFYIYWGPSPAVLLIGFRDETLSQIEDFHLTFFFAYGLFIYSALIAAAFWRKLKGAPIWVLIVSFLVLGLSIPITTMLRRGEVYEAAIFGSQFFFIGGCYWAFSSFKDETPIYWKFALAGIHWALAFGTRVTILPAVAFSAFIMSLSVFKNAHASWKNRLLPILWVGLPIVVGGIALALYNYSRFGSIVEFGVRYQLANVDYTKFNESFGTKYILENLKTYLFYPLKFKPRYPFISMVEYTPSNDRLSGLLYVAPFFTLAIIPVFRLLFKRKETTDPANHWCLILFAGSALISVATILSFFFITLRYTLDFLPSTLLLISIAIGMEYNSISENRWASNALSVVFGLLALTNVTTGVLLATPPNGIAFMVNLLNSISKLLGLR